MERMYLKKIKEQREKLNLKQTYLAEKLGITGASYSRQERGLSAMEVDTLIAICEVLNIKPEGLFTANVNEAKEQMTAILQIKLPNRIKDDLIYLLQKNSDELELLNQLS